MTIEGWYYLHENGDLIYKRDSDSVFEDFTESDLVKCFWSLDPTDREDAWNILVESLSIGARKNRVLELAEKWGCNNEDAIHYAERLNIILGEDGNQYTATRKDFVNLQESKCGFGDTYLEAMSDLCKQLGFSGGKIWRGSFKGLLK